MQRRQRTEQDADRENALLLRKLEGQGQLPEVEELDEKTEQQFAQDYANSTLRDAGMTIGSYLNGFSGFRILPPILQQYVTSLYAQQSISTMKDTFSDADFADLNSKLEYLSKVSDFLERAADLRPGNFESDIRAYINSQTDDDLDEVLSYMGIQVINQALSRIANVPAAQQRKVRRAMNEGVKRIEAELRHESGLAQFRAGLMSPEVTGNYSRSSLEAIIGLSLAALKVQKRLEGDYFFEQTERIHEEVLQRYNPYTIVKEIYGMDLSRYDNPQVGKGVSILVSYDEDDIEERLMQLTNFVHYERKLERNIQKILADIEASKKEAFSNIAWLNGLLQRNPRIAVLLSPSQGKHRKLPPQEIKDRHLETAEGRRLGDYVMKKLDDEALHEYLQAGEQIARYFDLAAMEPEERQKLLRGYNAVTLQQLEQEGIRTEVYLQGIPDHQFSVATQIRNERIRLHHSRKDLVTDISIGYDACQNEFHERALIEHLIDAATQFVEIYSGNKRIGMAMHFAAADSNGKPVLAVNSIALERSRRFPSEAITRITEETLSFIMEYAAQSGFGRVVVDGYNEDGIINKYGRGIKGKPIQEGHPLKKIGPHVLSEIVERDGTIQDYKILI